MIELIDYTDDMFDFVLDSNNINKPPTDRSENKSFLS